jgi:hypothetical protein
MNTLSTARTFQDLLLPDVAPSPYDYGVLFESKGFFARRRSKRRFKLLKNLDVDLQPLLQPGERVFFATCGFTASLAEQMFVGWAAQFLNRRAIVFTTSRVLLIQINRKLRPLDLVSQIRYEQIAKVRSTWRGFCEICLQDGKKLLFQGVAKAERKFLHRFLADVVRPIPVKKGEKVAAPEHLCRACQTVVPGHPHSCPRCSAAFKPASKAALLSLLFPGLGDYYLGHRGFAFMEMAGGAFAWLILVVMPLAQGGLVDTETGEIYAMAMGDWIAYSFFPLGILHGIDSIMTRHFARKGHHLSDRSETRTRLNSAPD